METITFDYGEFKKAIGIASAYAPKKSSRPILQCAHIVFDANSRQATIEATDAAIMFRMEIPYDGETSRGELSLDADCLNSYVKQLGMKNGPLSIGIDGNEATIMANGRKFAMPIAEGQYPSLASIRIACDRDEDYLCLGINVLEKLVKAMKASGEDAVVLLPGDNPMKTISYRTRKSSGVLCPCRRQ